LARLKWVYSKIPSWQLVKNRSQW